jgi:hypothetical protein
LARGTLFLLRLVMPYRTAGCRAGYPVLARDMTDNTADHGALHAPLGLCLAGTQHERYSSTADDDRFHRCRSFEKFSSDESKLCTRSIRWSYVGKDGIHSRGS